MDRNDRDGAALLAPPQDGNDHPGVDPETGEVLEQWDGTDLAPPEFSPGSLMRYARDKTELDALRMRLGDRVNALTAGDPEAASLAAQIAERGAEVSAIEAAFEAAFTPEQRAAQREPISLDLGLQATVSLLTRAGIAHCAPHIRPSVDQRKTSSHRRERPRARES